MTDCSANKECGKNFPKVIGAILCFLVFPAIAGLIVNHQIEEMNIREKVVQIAEYASLADTNTDECNLTGSSNCAEQYRKTNQLAHELLFYLPEEIYEELVNAYRKKGEAQKFGSNLNNTKLCAQVKDDGPWHGCMLCAAFLDARKYVFNDGVDPLRWVGITHEDDYKDVGQFCRYWYPTHVDNADISHSRIK